MSKTREKLILGMDNSSRETETIKDVIDALDAEIEHDGTLLAMEN